MTDTGSFPKEFATDVLRAIRSAAPLPDMERITTTLAEMVIALAEDNKALRELCESQRESADAGVWIIANAHLIKA